MENLNLIVEGFCKGVYDSDVSGSEWNKVFKYILENYESLSFNRDRVHTLWTVNGGHLRRKVENDELIASVLTLVLPGYEGEGMILYRGECRFLYEQNKIGFCWTSDFEVASMFASGLNAIESGGVLLKAFAPTAAILSEPNKHSAKQMQEFEHTCNPYLLENIVLVYAFEKLYT
ncbi:hypothetical protein [Dasania marina]|uniref:hypothetical protein n=1 Tax=Dasania marina TaxID=471499 RepID=UPI00037C734C|nr:hypothetical protein [Dasania marina]